MNNHSLSPKIYVACLAAYNNGYLHGAWIDVSNSTKEDIETKIYSMLAQSPCPQAEEWAIHDYEDFGGIRLSEYSGTDDVLDAVAFIDEHGELGAEVAAYFDDMRSGPDSCQKVTNLFSVQLIANYCEELLLQRCFSL
jgi:antirestriction protein